MQHLQSQHTTGAQTRPTASCCPVHATADKAVPVMVAVVAPAFSPARQDVDAAPQQPAHTSNTHAVLTRTLLSHTPRPTLTQTRVARGCMQARTPRPKHAGGKGGCMGMQHAHMLTKPHKDTHTHHSRMQHTHTAAHKHASCRCVANCACNTEHNPEEMVFSMHDAAGSKRHNHQRCNWHGRRLTCLGPMKRSAVTCSTRHAATQPNRQHTRHLHTPQSCMQTLHPHTLPTNSA